MRAGDAPGHDEAAKPEEQARQRIDAALEAAGWCVQDAKATNLWMMPRHVSRRFFRRLLAVSAMRRSQNYESFIGSAYAAPIFTLVEELERDRGTPNEVQASMFEHGRSASIIALTTLLLESFLNISKFITGSNERSVRRYFETTFPTSAYQDELVELFAIRDVIAHNHVWRGEIDPVAMTWISLELAPGYGDKAFLRVVDLKTRLTKKLKLHIVPTRLSYDDVRITIQTTAAILAELREWHLAQPDAYFVGTGGFGLVRYRGQFTTFDEAAQALGTAV